MSPSTQRSRWSFAAAFILIAACARADEARPRAPGAPAGSYAPPSWAPERVRLEDAVHLPIAIDVAPSGRWLVAANRGSATWTLIDATERRAIAEHKLPEGSLAADIAIDERGERIAVAVADARQHRLAMYDGIAPELTLRWTVDVARRPAALAFAPSGESIWVAAAGDGVIAEHAVRDGAARRVVPAIEGARRLAVEHLPAGGYRLLVSGRSAVARFDPASSALERVHELTSGNARNIGALTAGDSGVHVAHQIQPTEAGIDPQMIVWGLILANRVTSLVDEGEHWSERETPLDQRSRAAGDPTALVELANGSLVMASGGTDRLLFIGSNARDGVEADPLTRETALPDLAVPGRPVDIALDGERLWVASHFADAIYEVDLGRREIRGAIPLRIPAGASTARLSDDAFRGARIFFDSRRSRGGWYSCHSCHPDGGTEGHLFDTSADGDGLAKKAPSLRGVAETGPWSWTGRFESLEEQVAASLHRTMAVNSPASPEDVRAVVAYLGTLDAEPAAPLATAAAQRGGEVFSTSGCAGCHRPPTWTRDGVEDAGVHDEHAGRTRFNPPSLRGVRDGRRFLHDGRARTLLDVFRIHDEARLHGEAHRLSPSTLADLIAYLETL